MPGFALAPNGRRCQKGVDNDTTQGIRMEDYGIVAWLVSLVGFGIPIGNIFRRAGFSAWWGLLGLLSFLGLLIAWIVLALRDWRWREVA
jgi:hypothetical protein